MDKSNEVEEMSKEGHNCWLCGLAVFAGTTCLNDKDASHKKWSANNSFDEWFNKNLSTLQDRYFNSHQEDYPTSDSLSEMERDPAFQEWCEEEFEKVE